MNKLQKQRVAREKAQAFKRVHQNYQVRRRPATPRTVTGLERRTA